MLRYAYASVLGMLATCALECSAATLEIVVDPWSVAIQPNQSVELEIAVVNQDSVDSPPIVSARAGLSIQSAAGAAIDALSFGAISPADTPLFPGPPLSPGGGLSTAISVGAPNPIMGEVLTAGEQAGIAVVAVTAAANAAGKYFVLLSPFDLQDQFGSEYLTLTPLPVRNGFSNPPDPDFRPSSVLAEITVVPEPATSCLVAIMASQLALVRKLRTLASAS